MPKLSDHGICIIHLPYIHAQKAFSLLFSVDPENVFDKSSRGRQQVAHRRANRQKLGGYSVHFTDGSCRENLWPCGARACVYLPGQEECGELKKPVSRLASILLGELVAIEI